MSFHFFWRGRLTPRKIPVRLVVLNPSVGEEGGKNDKPIKPTSGSLLSPVGVGRGSAHFPLSDLPFPALLQKRQGWPKKTATIKAKNARKKWPRLILLELKGSPSSLSKAVSLNNLSRFRMQCLVLATPDECAMLLVW